MLARQVTQEMTASAYGSDSTRDSGGEPESGTKDLPQAFADCDSSARPDVCEAVAVRRALPFLALAALVAVLVIGLTQAGGESGDGGSAGPSLTEARRALAGAPEPLAALYERGNTIEASDPDRFAEQLRSLRGHPVVVNAWATWCGPCKLEFPFFQRAAVRLGKRVAFLGLNVSDSRRSAERFLEKRPVPYPSLEDGSGATLREVAPGVRGLPVTIFYDARGERTFVHQGGYRDEDDLLDDVRRYATSG
jgi:cytochrome c biogenesis protein CcmG/thiol:disulfide interchange protein DsbE